MGFLVGWFAFRWYHLPVRQGAGWAWGARSKERAFGVGVGVGGYVGDEGWGSERLVGGDLENGNGTNGVSTNGVVREGGSSGGGETDIPLEDVRRTTA